MPGRVVRVPNLKSGDPNFNSRSDNLLVLSQVDPALSPRLCLSIGQLGFLTRISAPIKNLS